MAKEVAFDREKYSAAVDKYRREPSLENYIDLRRFPGSIGVGITAFPSGDVLLEMTDDSRMAGIPPEALLNVVACDKYDEEAIDTLSLWTI